MADKYSGPESKNIAMNDVVVVSERIIEVLRKVRSNAIKSLEKKETLDILTSRITRTDAAIDDLIKGYNSLESEHERKERRDEVEKVATELEELEALKRRLLGELNTINDDLLYYRQRLEDELWRALVGSGQVRADEGISEIVPDQLEGEAHCVSSQDPRHVCEGDQRAIGDEQSCSANDLAKSDDCRIQEAEALLDSSKADLCAAVERFQYLDRLCMAQRQQFETRIIPEWHDMSRTEFDLEQLAQKIEHTRELIRAEKAYSEAGRFAKEVGFIREDSDQSCHFVDEPDDGAHSGDRHATFVEDNDMTFVEDWREGISPPSWSPSARSPGDVWEVDSVRFGEGCSTHAEEWNKIRIDRWDEMREGSARGWAR